MFDQIWMSFDLAPYPVSTLGQEKRNVGSNCDSRRIFFSSLSTQTIVYLCRTVHNREIFRRKRVSSSAQRCRRGVGIRRVMAGIYIVVPNKNPGIAAGVLPLHLPSEIPALRCTAFALHRVRDDFVA